MNAYVRVCLAAVLLRLAQAHALGKQHFHLPVFSDGCTWKPSNRDVFHKRNRSMEAGMNPRCY
jgi:hypothetical protein